jgi:type II secretory pathway component PulK
MVLSARIVAHRERHGPFRRVEELLAVRGIGPRLFARIAPLVTVDEAGPAAAPDRAPAPEPPGDRRPPSAP